MTSSEGTPRRIRVLLADDEPLIRVGLGLIIDSEADLDLVGEANDGAEALNKVSELHPDVIVMDVRMPTLNGVEATRQLTSDTFTTATGVSPAILMLTTFNDDQAVDDALRAGASGFLLKSAASHTLGDAIRALASGGGWLDPAVTRRLFAEFASRPDPSLPAPAELARLTNREREVMRLIAHGLTNSMIAEHLVISEATVKTHVGRIMMKCGLHDRSQIVSAAFKTGLVEPKARLPGGSLRRQER